MIVTLMDKHMTLEKLISKLPLCAVLDRCDKDSPSQLTIDFQHALQKWAVCYYDPLEDAVCYHNNEPVMCVHKDLSKALYQMIDLINSIDCLKYYGD